MENNKTMNKEGTDSLKVSDLEIPRESVISDIDSPVAITETVPTPLLGHHSLKSISNEIKNDNDNDTQKVILIEKKTFSGIESNNKDSFLAHALESEGSSQSTMDKTFDNLSANTSVNSNVIDNSVDNNSSNELLSKNKSNNGSKSTDSLLTHDVGKSPGEVLAGNTKIDKGVLSHNLEYLRHGRTYSNNSSRFSDSSTKAHGNRHGSGAISPVALLSDSSFLDSIHSNNSSIFYKSGKTSLQSSRRSSFDSSFNMKSRSNSINSDNTADIDNESKLYPNLRNEAQIKKNPKRMSRSASVGNLAAEVLQNIYQLDDKVRFAMTTVSDDLDESVQQISSLVDELELEASSPLMDFIDTLEIKANLIRNANLKEIKDGRVENVLSFLNEVRKDIKPDWPRKVNNIRIQMILHISRISRLLQSRNFDKDELSQLVKDNTISGSGLNIRLPGLYSNSKSEFSPIVRRRSGTDIYGSTLPLSLNMNKSPFRRDNDRFDLPSPISPSNFSNTSTASIDESDVAKASSPVQIVERKNAPYSAPAIASSNSSTSRSPLLGESPSAALKYFANKIFNWGRKKDFVSELVVCRICEEQVEKSILEEHTQICLLAAEADVKAESIETRLKSLINAIESNFKSSTDSIDVSKSSKRSTSFAVGLNSLIGGRRGSKLHRHGTIMDDHFKSSQTGVLGGDGLVSPRLNNSQTPIETVLEIAKSVLELEVDEPDAITLCKSLLGQLDTLLGVTPDVSAAAFGKRIRSMIKEKIKVITKMQDVNPKLDKLDMKMQNALLSSSPPSGTPPIPKIVRARNKKHGRTSSFSKRNKKGMLPRIQDFMIIKKLGGGAYGNVWLAKKKKTGDIYAIKVLKKTDMVLKNQVEHIQSERSILSKTKNAFVVKLFYSFKSKEHLFLVMEYISGGDLYQFLEEKIMLSENHAKHYIAELILAVQYLHKHKIVHRDIKPDNIMISHNGHLKLTDFGLSKVGLFERQVVGDADAGEDSDDSGNDGYPRSRKVPITPRRKAMVTRAKVKKFGGKIKSSIKPLAFSSSADSDFDSSSDKPDTPPHHSAVAFNLPDIKILKDKDTPENGNIVKFGDKKLDLKLDLTRVRDNSLQIEEEKINDSGVIGTPDYLAPEILLGTGHGYEVDWWAIGIVLYEMLTGCPPFNDETPEKIFENILMGNIEFYHEEEAISSDAEDLITKLLDQDPNKRLGHRGGDEIKNHPFFKDIDWNSILESEATYLPEEVHPEQFPDDIPQNLKGFPWEDLNEELDATTVDEEFKDFTSTNLNNLAEMNRDLLTRRNPHLADDKKRNSLDLSKKEYL